MKTKLLFFIPVLIILCAPCVKCEIVEYSDNYLSFEYDTDDYISIFLHETDDNRFMPLSYSISADMKLDSETCYCSIWLGDSTDDWINKLVKTLSATVISEDPFEFEYVDETGSQVLEKIIGEHGNQMLLIAFTFTDIGDEGYSAIKNIYDTAICSDTFTQSGYEFSSEKSDYIYKNVIHSAEAIALAKQALNICNAYLSFQIDSSSASDRMESIIDAADDLEKKTLYNFDSDLYSAIFTSGTYFYLENDAQIVKTQIELEKISAQ